jgi:hypothetical protein
MVPRRALAHGLLHLLGQEGRYGQPEPETPGAGVSAEVRSLRLAEVRYLRLAEVLASEHKNYVRV